MTEWWQPGAKNICKGSSVSEVGKMRAEIGLGNSKMFCDCRVVGKGEVCREAAEEGVRKGSFDGL